jgi:hypothetical protein
MQTITLIIEDESKALNPSELADFLYLFRAANLALKRIVPEDLHRSLAKPTQRQVALFRTQLERLSPRQLNAFFAPRTHPDVLGIQRMIRQSPLEIVVGGCAFLIAVGVFVSGGKIAISWSGVTGGLKAELPPLGEGIKRLREALGLDKTIQASFGIHPTVIRFSEEEYKALCLQDDSSKGRGGFQRFLVELKSRTNKRTKSLELSERDLERIHRYKANPSKGGWQSRFKKIFGRHFPESA